MPKCIDILNSILERTGLDRDDRHPLYRYRITQIEIEQLRIELQHQLDTIGALKWPEDCAAFCLFAAEWFRRHYDQGVWRWDIILDGLERKRDQQAYLRPKLLEFTKKGLRWWRLELISTELTKRYLTTLVCQGGFPINTLKNDGAGLSRLLKACLRDHERFPTEPLGEIIGKYVGYIPITLDNGEVRGLVANLVRAIALLRKESDAALDTGTSRGEFLDQHAPGWEKSLPLRVEESESKDLLLSLLDTAKSQPFSRDAMSLSTTLSFEGACGYISRTLRFPSSMTDEDFRRLCGFSDVDDVLPRMTGFLQAGEQRIACVSISRSQDGKSFRLSKLAADSLSGSQVYQTTCLILAVGGEEIRRIALPGGESLPDSPWIFTDEDPNQLIGLGSARPRDCSVLVALPVGSQLQASVDTATESLGIQVGGRDLIRLTGDVTIISDEAHYRIVTKSSDEKDCLYELRGIRTRLGTSGSEVWRGVPSIYEIPVSDEALPREVASDRLEWRPKSGGEWRSNFTQCLGNVLLRVLDGRETKFLTRSVVFPSRFSMRVVPGQHAGTGELRLDGFHDCEFFAKPIDGTELRVVKRNGQHIICVTVSGDRPNLLTMRIRFSNANDCDVYFVCPTSSVSIIDVNGQSLPPDTGIPIERLDGLTLQVVQAESRVPLVYLPDFPLLVDQVRETKVQGLYELPLSYIRNHAKEILSLSDSPDSSVTFGVGHNVAFKPSFSWKIARYAQGLQKARNNDGLLGFEGQTRVFVSDQALSHMQPGRDLSLSVTPLGYPKDEMPAGTIERFGPGNWLIRHADYQPGFYLAVARHSDSEPLRPLRFAVKHSEIPKSTSGTILAAEQFDQVLNIDDNDMRRKAWDQFFDSLGRDMQHPGWDRVHDLVQASESLPITTYEAVAALTRNPYAVARYGILDPKNVRQWQRFEELPFLWSLVPVKAWMATALRCLEFVKSSLEAADIPAEQIEKIIVENTNLFAIEAPSRVPSLACVLLCMYRVGNFAILPTSLRPNGLDVETRQIELARLLGHHDRFDTRATWPNFRIDFSDEVRAIFNTTPDLAILETHRNQWAILNGPAIAAVHSVYGFPTCQEQVIQFKRLRALDAEWFDRANAIAMYLLIDQRFSSDENCFAEAMEISTP